MKRLKPVEKNGTLNLHATADGVDWMRAGRLLEAAKKGDKAAAKELKEMEDTPMIKFSLTEMEVIRKAVKMEQSG